MARRTKTEWCELIEQQKASGLSAAEFCCRNSIKDKCFSTQKQKLKGSTGNFVRVAAPAARPSPVATNGIKVRVVELEIPGEAVGAILGF
ncbi:MAG: hypothetical protein ACI9FB_001386 [Candidatus Azotimanducaceae bacterium]|jgi:hypothetical protein